METVSKVKWYEKSWFFWMLMIFVPYIGVPFMWIVKKDFSAKKKIIFSIIFGLYAFLIIGSSLTSDTSVPVSQQDVGQEISQNLENEEIEKEIEAVSVVVIDFSTMSKEEIQVWAQSNEINIEFENEYSDTLEKGLFINQSEDVNNEVLQGDKITITYSLGEEPSTEFKNALVKAESYSEIMNMSKQGIYDQLTSQYGEQFPSDAAQYAIDNMTADWNDNALAKAESYSDTMNMSKQGIYDQLTSEYGEQFTKEEAQYAVDNMVADWNANALAKAKSYQETMNMSKNAIYDQLVSQYGEQFTAEQAQYAIDNLE